MADDQEDKKEKQALAASAEEPKTEAKAGEQPKVEEKPADEPKVEEAKAETKAEPKSEAKAEKPKADVPAKFKKLVEEVEKMSVLELSELVHALEERFGVSAAAPVAVAAAPPAGGEAGAPAEEAKKEMTVILKEAGDKKIEVIKAVREISGLGLAESKAIADSAPKTVKENMPAEEAEEAKKKLEAAGATVELQ